MWTIEQLKKCRESEDKVEFKRGEHGNVAYDGGTKTKPSDRRRCILGYVVALCNERGGTIVIGMEDRYPHKVVGTRQNENALGDLVSSIYRDTGIRPDVYELFEDVPHKTGRVVVIEVPPRPSGKVYKFEDVPLMRVGEELRPMSDECLYGILQEQEPDFSQQICESATIEDLDDSALDILREKYARKQNNPGFLTLPKNQVLSDLNLVVDGKVTNGAVILVGKESFIRRTFPQAAVMLEYRSTEAQIPFDNRQEYHEPFFVMIERLWRDINLRNGSIPVREGPYVFDIPVFNEDVIREAVNNAIAHRDYRRQSETVIRQYPQRFTIANAGGFPPGVTMDNLLTVPSTPRNRLLADVLAKTGIVERSGQGVDKIFSKTLSEGKAAPDYSASDDFNVVLTLKGSMKDRAFALFVESVQQTLPDEEKLSVFEILALSQIRDGKSGDCGRNILHKLQKRGLVEKRGRTRGTSYILCRGYYEFTGNMSEYARKSDWSLDQMLKMIEPYIVKYNGAKMGDLVGLLDGHLTRRQIRVYVQRLVENQILIAIGKGSGTRYVFSGYYLKSHEIVDKALKIGLEEMAKREETEVENVQRNG